MQQVAAADETAPGFDLIRFLPARIPTRYDRRSACGPL